MSPVSEPMGAALDDHEIFRRLAREFDTEAAFTEGRDTEAWLRWLWSEAQSRAAERAITLPDFGRFKAAGKFELPPTQKTYVLFEDFIAAPEAHALATESGKITLYNEAIAKAGFE